MFTRAAPEFWRQRGPAALALVPVALLFQTAIAIRRAAYRIGILSQHHAGVPTIVVGNLTVGGTGKTPLVAWLCRFLRQEGFKVGVVSRGYGAASPSSPLSVEPDTSPALAGDEPVLLARLGACPVVVHRDRVRAVRALVNRESPDVIVSDDGLQHYRLDRDLEIVTVDGESRLGNGLLLPAGPLREPASRLADCDLVICNGGKPRSGEVPMRLCGTEAVSLHPDRKRRPLDSFSGARVHAVAGIAHPQRFFGHLRRVGLTLDEHSFPDHHAYGPGDFAFADGAAILMTEKDAVKCEAWSLKNAWYVPVWPTLPDSFGAKIAAAISGARARD